MKSNTWKIIGIASLYLSAFGLVASVAQDKNPSTLFQGMFIGEASVFLVWAIKETLVFMFREKKDE